MVISWVFASIFSMIGAIVLASAFAPAGYHWTTHTISDLASQAHDKRWIMQAGFIGFGSGMVIALILKSMGAARIAIPDLFLILYGFSIMVTGFFCEKPVDVSLPYSAVEAKVHSLFAMGAGIALCIGMFGYAWSARTIGERAFHVFFLVAISAISGAFGLAENHQIPLGKGLIQRVLYVTSFIWIAASQYPGAWTRGR